MISSLIFKKPLIRDLDNIVKSYYLSLISNQKEIPRHWEIIYILSPNNELFQMDSKILILRETQFPYNLLKWLKHRNEINKDIIQDHFEKGIYCDETVKLIKYFGFKTIPEQYSIIKRKTIKFVIFYIISYIFHFKMISTAFLKIHKNWKSFMFAFLSSIPINKCFTIYLLKSIFTYKEMILIDKILPNI